MTEGPLAHIRVCDMTGQLAGASATRFLAAMGAQVIRVEDPVRKGAWDILRGAPPFADERRGQELGGAFNNHNVGKLGVTLDLRQDRGRQLLAELIAVSDIVTENFSAGVFERLGFSYEGLRAIRPDIIYASQSGFGHSGPYRSYRSWGPTVQAICGLAFQTGIADRPPAGIGYSYMDHHGGNFLVIALLSALIHRDRTGEGQWIDMSSSEAGAALTGPDSLDYAVNGRRLRDRGVDSNHSRAPHMVPHNIYPAAGSDEWIALACRHDADWARLAGVVGEVWAYEQGYTTLEGRSEREGELDVLLAGWTCSMERSDLVGRLRQAGIPAAIVARPEDRIDHDPRTEGWGLWPEVRHSVIGDVRVEGLPIHLSARDWSITTGAPRLGEHNREVFGGILGMSEAELTSLESEGVL